MNRVTFVLIENCVKRLILFEGILEGFEQIGEGLTIICGIFSARVDSTLTWNILRLFKSLYV